MFQPKRIIGRLDIKGSNVIKGIQMEGLRVVGDPRVLSRLYYEQGADELIYIDTVASLYGRDIIENIVKLAAQEIFIPLTVGGGIRTVEDAKRMLLAGADKVAVNSGAIRNPSLLTDIAKIFGNQCVVVSIEAKKTSTDKWEAYIDNGREPSGLDVLEWAKLSVELGAGEVLLTSVDRDGTKKGLDIALISALSESVSIPVIASGGVGDANHVVEAFVHSDVDGIAMASVLHSKKFTISGIKQFCKDSGIAVRTTE